MAYIDYIRNDHATCTAVHMVRTKTTVRLLGHHILTVELRTQIKTPRFRQTSDLSDTIQQFTRHNDGIVKSKIMFHVEWEMQKNRSESKFT